MKRALAAAAAAIALFGAAPHSLDSALVLQRYSLELSDATMPKTMIFGYSISQLGTTDIEQKHMLYRTGNDVRDETLSVDGIALKPKIVSFGRRADRYAVDRVAPRTTAYDMLFTKAVRDGSHVDYAFDVTPVGAGSPAFTVTRVVIDGISFLPREIDFKIAGETAHGNGKLFFGKAEKFWMPMLAMVDARVNGKPARERIVFSDYRFPHALPPSTFVPPRPLPNATLPPI